MNYIANDIKKDIEIILMNMKYENLDYGSPDTVRFNERICEAKNEVLQDVMMALDDYFTEWED